MNAILNDLRAMLVSLKLTVVLIIFSIILILAATLDQVNLGIWAVQEKYFHTFVVFKKVGSVSLAIFPGGYTIGGLLLLNLLAAHFYRFQLSWKKSGIWLAHAGLILLLVGQLLTGLMSDEYQLRLDPGQTKNFAESYRNVELAITDTTDPKFDTVVAIPEKPLRQLETIQNPKLPFRVAIKTYLPNAKLTMRGPMQGPDPTSVADKGIGPEVLATLQPLTYKQDERNIPAANVELIGPEGSIGTWLVSPQLEEPQRFSYGGREWKLALRFARRYEPFTLTLIKFSHDRYAGTDIPKNFSSRVRVQSPDGRDDREVLIYMNNPLRYAGLTFYQAGFENNDRTTVLQVVRNPSWQLPYVACVMMSLGLLIQFGIHLTGFIKRRRAGAAPGAATSVVAGATPRKNWVSLSILAVAVLAVTASLFPSRPKSEYDLTGFSRLPTLVNGRIKPLDTVARTTLLMLQGRQRVAAPNGREISPGEWLLDVLYRPEVANGYQTFEIVNPDVLALLNLTPDDGAGKKRYSFHQLVPGLGELERQAKLAEEVESALRTPFQQAVIQLRDGIVLFQSLQVSLVPPNDEHYLGDLEKFNATVAAGSAAAQAHAAHDSADAKALLELSNIAATLEQLGYLRPIPPVASPTDPAGWRNAGAALGASLQNGRLDPSLDFYAALGRAWKGYQPAAFNQLVRDYRAGLDRTIPGFMAKCDTEARFNGAQPFYTSMNLYVLVFLLAVFSWLKWPGPLGRSAYQLMILAWLLATVGIGVRMWLEGRPPVTNLYSSALFVGWVGVLLCIVLERLYRNGIGSATGGVVGFSSLVIAHHLALGGDTLEMMRAVLDSNFWLATHVVTVTVGYAATFLAGFLALVYVIRGTMTKSLDQATADSLARMVYGIVCFATLFSLIGTVLGGIWADQSWGRFWGWDPKENGALIIVLWNALILHARWGGLVKQRGLMNLAIFGNIVTGWSWFGVNMLGVGLHSYGFMAAAFWWLLGFVVSQLGLIALGGIPLAKWRSFRAAETV